MQRRTSTVIPFLRYRDAAAAIDWLVAAFGCERRMVTPGPDGAIAHAELGFGPDTVMVGSDEHAAGAGFADARSAPFGIYVVVEAIDDHYARARSAGATIVQELGATDYESREYAVRDPEGYIWSFGTYAPAAK
jgi:uncharacterized glyoxalase superfamily protein PhnB